MFDDIQFVQETETHVDVDFYLSRSDGSELLIRVSRDKETNKIEVSPPRLAETQEAEFGDPDLSLMTAEVFAAIDQAMPEIHKLLGFINGPEHGCRAPDVCNPHGYCRRDPACNN